MLTTGREAGVLWHARREVVNVVVLTGTKQARVGDAPQCRCAASGYDAFLFGHVGAKRSAQCACGLAVYLDRACFSRGHVVEVSQPAARPRQGRVGLVRVKQGSGLDVSVVAGYLPPEGALESETLASKCLDWTSALLRGLPRRTTPVVCMDANHKLGG